MPEPCRHCRGTGQTVSRSEARNAKARNFAAFMDTLDREDTERDEVDAMFSKDADPEPASPVGRALAEKDDAEPADPLDAWVSGS